MTAAMIKEQPRSVGETPGELRAVLIKVNKRLAELEKRSDQKPKKEENDNAHSDDNADGDDSE